MSTSIDPYEPPRSLPDAPMPPFRRVLPTGAAGWLKASVALGLASLGLFMGTMFLAGGGGRAGGSFARGAITFFLAVSTVSAGVAALSGARGVLLFARAAAGGKAWGVLASLLALVGSSGLTLFTFFMTVWSTSDFRRGRQLRRFGRVLLPPVVSAPSWSSLDVPGLDALPAEARVTAAQWRENGRTEHASVAAFAALTQDLMALGAPPALVASAQRDALDEIRHTELCFALARALDGQDLGPGPFPDARRRADVTLGRTFALARLAADSLVDGALHEGVSARVLAKLARRCEVPAVAAVLKEIAKDEGRHAAHGWDVVAWCVAEGGAPVVLALETALRALPDTMTSPLPAEAALGGWERLGIHGHALERAEYEGALARLRGRVAKLPRGSGAEIVAEAC